MPVQISVRTNLADIIRDLSDMQRKQLPFALARALTRTAQEARDYLRGNLDEHFTVRSTWVERSIQIDKADKRDADPNARVGSLYGPVALHAGGGTKTGRGGDGGVPVGARASPGDKTGVNTFPGKLSKKPGFFIAKFSRTPFRIHAGGTETGVFERRSMADGAFGPVAMRSRRKHSKAERSPRHLKLWWTLEDDVKIKADWPFFAESIGAVDRGLVDNFIAAMEYAMRTAK